MYIRTLVRLVPPTRGEERQFTRHFERINICEFEFKGTNPGALSEMEQLFSKWKIGGESIELKRTQDETGSGQILTVTMPCDITDDIVKNSRLIVGSVLMEWGVAFA